MFICTQSGLKKQCKEYVEWDDNYRQLMPLSDIPGVQPDDYLVRFPFYVVAERDAHIVFSPTDNPDWFADDVYEFGKYPGLFLFCFATYFVLVHLVFCFTSI